MTKPPPPSDFAHTVASERPFLSRLARRFRGQLDPDDLVQDTMTRALKYEERFKKGTNQRAWLATILTRLALDGLGRAYRKHEIAGEIETLAAPEADDADAWWMDLEVKAICEACARINPKACTVFRMFHCEGLSYSEIAERLGMAKPTVGTSLYRARTAIRRILEKDRKENADD